MQVGQQVYLRPLSTRLSKKVYEDECELYYLADKIQRTTSSNKSNN